MKLVGDLEKQVPGQSYYVVRSTIDGSEVGLRGLSVAELRAFLASLAIVRVDPVAPLVTLIEASS